MPSEGWSTTGSWESSELCCAFSSLVRDVVTAHYVMGKRTRLDMQWHRRKLEGLSGKHAKAAQFLHADLCKGLVAAHLALQLSCFHSKLLIGVACMQGHISSVRMCNCEPLRNEGYQTMVICKVMQ